MDTFVICLLLLCFPVGFFAIWIKGLKNHAEHGGWRGNTWSQAPYKLRRARYMLNHFGSWDAVMRAATYKDGVHVVIIPKELHDKIEADPLCHPPGKRK